jgi:glucose/arabinose dehydrogenase
MHSLSGFRRVAAIAFSLSVFFAPSPVVQAQDSTQIPASSFKLGLEVAADGFDSPLYVTHAGDGSNRIFVVEKGGTIRIIQDGKRIDKPFLDITPVVNSDASERGLLGLAFHPKYKENGLFYVYYTAQNGDVTIARYKVTSDANSADPESGEILLTIQHQRYANHNGGQLAFGPDGYLYIGIGDGGSGGDPNRNGQNTKALLAKILRIDVDSLDPYGIPADNPFADGKAGRPEVWAYGLRNPWRFSFDRKTGDLYIADVGQNQYEEIDVQRADAKGGVNYGWNVMEGLHCYGQNNCNQQGLIPPVAEYSHDFGCSVTGGYVYRGKSFSEFDGTYFYGDYCSGRIWAIQPSGTDQWTAAQVLESGRTISSFGEDEAGELYLTDLANGTVYRLLDEAK